IKKELDFHGINLYPYASAEDDEYDIELNDKIRALIPFSVIGSEQLIEVNGEMVRGRKNRWGVINVEDPTHSEFTHLREFLTRTHLQDLIETTQHRHYESYRANQILSLSGPNAQSPTS
ncbi:cell division/GTP binding protein, partial [Conidiobolus coronatus NRRL 28638]